MTFKFLTKVKSPAQEKSVKFLLHERLNGPEPDRGWKTVHASEMTKEGFCARAYALADLTKKKPGNRWLSTSERMTYALGDAMANMTVNTMADMGKAVCHWRCNVCNYLHEFQKRPWKCEKCGCAKFHYEEVRFESAASGASCGVDMLVSLGDAKLLPVELKTMAPDQFKSLAAPLAEHRVRTNLYLRIIAESEQSWANLVRKDRAAVLYISKGAYGCASPDLKTWGIKESFSPFKEFWIERDDVQTAEMTKEAMRIKAFRLGGVIPSGICSTALCKTAQGCRLKEECWSGEYPAGATMIEEAI